MIFAEFMDIFGFVGFISIFIIGFSLIKIVKKRALILIVISLIGLLVDGYIVLSNFILK